MSTEQFEARFRCDIFCRVVDNFGDVGVSLRLARQLASEFMVECRLIVDDMVTYSRLAQGYKVDGLSVIPWQSAYADDATVDVREVADLVIEAFACALPAAYIEAMAVRAAGGRPLCWINLEYLSAESWVGSTHLLPSPHRRLPLTKYFFFPGFDEKTGGLIREHNLLKRRDTELRRLATPEDANPLPRAYVLSYKNAATEALVFAMADSGYRVTVSSACPAATESWLEYMAERPYRAKIDPIIQPFVPQQTFDGVMWMHDVLFVRGEDSFVRAQWAGKPFIWHIYPQSDAVHVAKLDAFMERYCIGLEPGAAQALRALTRAWNAQDAASIPGAWRDFHGHLDTLLLHAKQWAENLAKRPDLATNLVTFYEKVIKI
jgi:uncharacterized repeat protein (TIGR03837 family)